MVKKMEPEDKKAAEMQDQEILGEKISNPIFNELEWAEKELRPRINEIMKMCHDKKVPIAVLFCSENTGEGARMGGASNLPGRRTPDHIRLCADILTDKKWQGCVLTHYQKHRFMGMGGPATLLAALLGSGGLPDGSEDTEVKEFIKDLLGPEKKPTDENPEKKSN